MKPHRQESALSFQAHLETSFVFFPPCVYWPLMLPRSIFLRALNSLIWRHLPFQGALFIYTAGGYALGRLALESLRDLRATGKSFTSNHAISLFIIAVSVAALAGRSLL